MGGEDNLNRDLAEALGGADGRGPGAPFEDDEGEGGLEGWVGEAVDVVSAAI